MIKVTTIVPLSFLLMLQIYGCTKVENMSENEESIGVAKMSLDGTIILQLRADSARGTMGDARFEYKPGDPEYSNIKKHLGDIAPEEEKLVLPWPETE
jgi:hypothetical protein